MAFKIRQRKKDNSKQHPDYLLGAERTWADNDRERTKNSFRRNFVAILAVMIVIAVLLIVATTSNVVSLFQEPQITAADSFAVSQYEQQQMESSAKTFAQGVLVFAYCNDQDTAFAGKNAALNEMVQGTDAYDNVLNLAQTNPIVAPANLVPVVTDPKTTVKTQAYAGDYTYTFSGVVADSSVTSEGNESGTFVDNGYNISVTFTNVLDEATNQRKWVIVDCAMQAK